MNRRSAMAAFAATILVAFGGTLAGVAVGQSLELQGESRLQGQYFSGAAGSKDGYLLDLSHRLTAKAPIGEAWQAELSYQIAAGYESLPAAYARLLKPRRKLYRTDDLRPFLKTASTGEFIAHNLDRAMVSYYGPSLTVDIGRQQIAFGSGQMVSPTDVFAPQAFSALADEIRSGVDGVRLRKPLGEMSQVDAGIVIPATGQGEDTAAYLASKLSSGATEWRPMVARFYRAQLLGLDIATAIGGTGLWWESAYTKPADEDGYLRSVLGGMRQLGPLSTVALEYHYNGAGRASPAEHLLLAQDFAYRIGGVSLLATHYIGMTANVRVLPLLTLSHQLIANLDDGSKFLRIGCDWEAWPDGYLALHWRRGFGLSIGPLGVPRSEFGRGEQNLLASLKIYH